MDRTDIDITERLSKDADLLAIAGLGGDENDGALYGGVDFETKQAAEIRLMRDISEARITIEALRANLVDAIEEGTARLAALRPEKPTEKRAVGHDPWYGAGRPR